MGDRRIIAITGPSGAGKTTLANKLALYNEVTISRHCTTRNRRPDDTDDFYRFLSHIEYARLFDDGKFLFSSGDGPVIDKKYGNFYGVLYKDCISAWEQSDTIILFCSYKDIYSIINLKNKGYNIDIVNLTFYDIASAVESRLRGDIIRGHSEEDINSRINIAISDTNEYGKMVENSSSCNIYTDALDIEKTYFKVCEDLKIKKKER